MIKAVLFDLDDTLFDHRHSSRTALRVLQEQFPAVLGAISIDVLEKLNLSILNEIHVEVLNGSIDTETARRKRFSQLFSFHGLELSPEKQSQISAQYRDAYRASWRAAAGTIALLKELREQGVKIGILSNNLVAEQMEKLNVCGLSKLIDSLTISEEAGVAKPDIRIFHLALKRLRCAPDEAAMIGDSWENDIAPAMSLGMRAIWFNAYGIAPPDGNVYMLTTFQDTEEIVRGILNP